MPQQVRTRKQSATLEYSANNKVAEQLSRGMVYRELLLRLQGAPTLTAANNTTAKTEKGDEWAVAKKIEIIANGTDVIKTYTGEALWWHNYFLYGMPPKVTSALGDAATANPAFDSLLILPFWMPRSVRPIEYALDSRELSSLEIAVTWGSFTSINSDATAWTTEPSIQVYSLESFNISGPFNQWRTFPIEQEITADNPQFQIKLPVGPMYRGFLINTTDAGVDEGDILNNFKLVSGTTVFADMHAQDDILAQWFRLRNGAQRTWDSAAGAYDDFRRSADSDIAGWYAYDHVTDGFNTEAIDTLGFSEFILEADVSVGAGTTKIIVYPQQIIPVRGNNG